MHMWNSSLSYRNESAPTCLADRVQQEKNKKCHTTIKQLRCKWKVQQESQTMNRQPTCGLPAA